MRIFADENIQTPTIRFLQDLGYDAEGVKDVGLQSEVDPVIFDYAQREQRVLLTFNADFVDLRDLAKKEHAGIIRLRITNQRVVYVHPILQAALRRLGEIDLKNTLVTVSDRRTRVRKTSSP